MADHCHYSGKFRGAACNDCNLQLKFTNYKLPVYFHNGKGFDFHFLVQNIGKYVHGNINVLPNSMEKFLSIEYGNIKFVDSIMLFQGSIDSLTSSLKQSGLEVFKIMSAMLEKDKKLDLLEDFTRKGVFPHSAVHSHEYFERGVAPIEDFYDVLKQQKCEQEDYEFFCKMYVALGCKNMGEYSDWYLKNDVCLLADIIENSRKSLHSKLKLDPAWYITLGSFANAAMYHMTQQKIKSFTDVDMHMMTEEGIRGGITAVPHRFVHALNKYTRKNNSKLHKFASL